MAKAGRNAPLAARDVTLLAASKGQPVTAIEAAIEAGVTCFGENRVGDAGEKWVEIKKRHPNVALHLIGPLQTNKVKDALSLFDVIQTIDREKLADEIAKAAGGKWQVTSDKHYLPPATCRLPLITRHFYIQVNTGKEPQKAGVIPEEADALIARCRKLQLPVVGLMCIPPAGQPCAPHFALLKKIADRHGLKELSMGMSGDFETAIRMGSTCVRIGTALFGERKN